MADAPKIAAAYIRVSTDDQEEYSPDSQLKLCQEYAKREGFLIPEDFIFQDDGISAASAKKRTQFNRMIAMAKEKDRPFDAILVWKFSRFARNREESVFYKSMLRKCGVSVISISEPIADGPFGSLIESIIEWFDEYYLINLATEVKRGMYEKFTRGEAMATAPFGYKIDSEKKTYVIDPERAAIIQEIFSSYLAGKGFRRIALDLQERGVKTLRGGNPDVRFVDYVLHNPVYIGKIRWSTDGKAASKRKYDHPSVCIVDGLHEAIISNEQWNAVQERLRTVHDAFPKWQRRDEEADWMLKGLLRCSNCGATLCLGSLKQRTVQCHNYAAGRGCNVSHHLRLSLADASTIEALEAAVEHFDFPIAPAKPKQGSVAVDYSKLIAVEERRLRRCKEAYADGVDTLEEYAANKKEIQRKIAQYLSEQSKTGATPKIDKAAFAKKVSAVLALLRSPDASDAAKNAALRTIVDHIDFDKSASALRIFFSP